MSDAQTLRIRPAQPGDADAAIDVVRASITRLCTADHWNDEATLAQWLANKTAENFRSWIANADNFCVIAEDADTLAGVGLLHRSGEIRLFYLAPNAQRHGIGRTIHSALERKARAWELPALHLESTAFACRFYEAMGYHRDGAVKARFGVLQCHPYRKAL